MKTPYSDGTTQVLFEPLDFIARLAALVPKPRINLTRFQGVFAPNNTYQALVTPARLASISERSGHNRFYYFQQFATAEYDKKPASYGNGDVVPRNRTGKTDNLFTK